ncbi:MAG: homoserine O-acetyltransferase [Deltaproteobacteria bacterium]|nr:homoserine O-acetyltransferase [Deltaproteobacteria bacterium]
MAKFKNSVGLTEKKKFTFEEPLCLESGEEIGPVTIAYETFGKLNTDKSNAILICHALTGDSHVAGYYSSDDLKPGWWETMVGPGKGIDTNKYFVICSNILSGCMGSTGPSSTNPKTGKPYGLDFPVVTIQDIVKAQKKLIEHLQIEKLLCVIGGSLGGMQVLKWASFLPHMVGSAVILASTLRHSALAIAFNEVARQSIVNDPNWNNGHYYDGQKPSIGLSIARMIGHITYLSDESMRQKFGRRLQGKTDLSFDLDVDFQVESYLHYQGAKFVDRFDANSLLYITKAADYFDLTSPNEIESLDILKESGTKFLIVSYTSDWLYPTYQSRSIVKVLKKNGLDVSFCEIEADCGHDAFLLPSEKLTNMITGFLKARPKVKKDAI